MQFACIAGDGRVPPELTVAFGAGNGETQPQDPAPRTGYALIGSEAAIPRTSGLILAGWP